ncbi:MAG: RES family NAD+ phosphorylase [Bdellovibrionota bacterium]
MNFPSKEIEEQYFELFEFLKKFSLNSIQNEKNFKVYLQKFTANYKRIVKNELDKFNNNFEVINFNKNMCRLVGRFFDSSPLSVLGSRGRSSRYHYKSDEHDCIYFTESETVALKECNRGILTPSPPGTLYWFQLSLRNVLDLSTKKSCVKAGINYSGIIDKEHEWRMINAILNTKSYSQEIGKLVYENGFEGILYRSIKDDGAKNLVIFPKNMLKDSLVAVLDGGQPDYISHISPEDRILNGYI